MFVITDDQLDLLRRVLLAGGSFTTTHLEPPGASVLLQPMQQYAFGAAPQFTLAAGECLDVLAR